MDPKTSVYAAENEYRSCVRLTLERHVPYAQAREFQSPVDFTVKNEELTLPPYEPFPDDRLDPTAYLRTQSTQNVNNLL